MRTLLALEAALLALLSACDAGSVRLTEREAPATASSPVDGGGGPGAAGDGGSHCDGDGDGYPAPRCTAGSGDCDDRDPATHPGAPEAHDGVDDDCDGIVDEGTAAWDADGDCVCVAEACTGSENPLCASVTGGDCDDADPSNFPGNAEVCDALDNDCDQVADDGLPIRSWWVDVDGDGWGSQVAAPTQTCADPPAGTVANNADCDDLHANVAPFLAEVACDGLDNDCDPSTRDGEDDDRDEVDHCFDCDDDDPDRSPAHAEICNGRDDDCDGEADDGLEFEEYWPDVDGDGYGDERANEVELCEEQAGWVDNDDDCDDWNSWVNPSATEWHCDWIDNDCKNGDKCP